MSFQDVFSVFNHFAFKVDYPVTTFGSKDQAVLKIACFRIYSLLQPGLIFFVRYATLHGKGASYCQIAFFF